MRTKKIITIAVCAGLLSACGQTESGSSTANSTSSAAGSGQEVTIDNCGFEVKFATTPSRTVTLEQASTDTLLALGVEDRMVGTSNLKTSVLPEYQAAFDAIPVLAAKVISAEELRNADPDFVYSPFQSFFTADKVGTREELRDLGVNTYHSNVECRDYGDNKGKSAFDLIEKDISDLGKIYGVEDRAKELIAEQNKAIEAAKNKGDGTTVLYLYSLYKGAPYVAGSLGVGQSISDITGAKNVMEDVSELWPEVGWEAIADKNPDVIVVGDLKERGAPGDSYEDKIAAMKEDPIMSQLDAVKHDRFIRVPGVELDANVRSVNSLTIIADELANGIATKGAQS
ncbi:MAG: ABC transporter substrate-binding protein [Corynebacterium sp.]|uniref:ABC transporter substrate-binding protein n=1 Tax=Corynebacterium sp. TaxID=1720 RepID=UPI0026DD9FCF|nr:ABC transporter substrate-binding protein [Corynebacterium sp.]MDO5097899.1 ABC transporter substrate-binding protein [Corynebacterium sp.]